MGFLQKFSEALETWLYELNERNHWFFRFLEWGNDLYAAVVFRGVRRRAAGIDEMISGRDREFRMRFLVPEDEAMLGELFGAFDFTYLPPHALDAGAVGGLLRRASYLPFGLFRDGECVGYCLVRLIAPRSCFSGVWSFPVIENAGLSRAAVKRSGAFTDSEGLIDFVTVPLDNLPSKKGAEWAGWETLRANRRFYLMRRPIPPRLFPFARSRD
jgi:hypothetical protein